MKELCRIAGHECGLDKPENDTKLKQVIVANLDDCHNSPPCLVRATFLHCPETEARTACMESARSTELICPSRN